MFHKASEWYEISPWVNNNGCKSIEVMWEKDLGCTFEEETWEKILSNNGEHIREARSKFIQYEILHRCYNTPTRLNKMSFN